MTCHKRLSQIAKSCLNAKTGSRRGYNHQRYQSSDERRRINSSADQQEAPDTLDPAQKQEVQQVCKSAPPLETVANKTANEDPGNPSCRSFMVNERLMIEAAEWRKAGRESEDREDEGELRSDKKHRFTQKI